MVPWRARRSWAGLWGPSSGRSFAVAWGSVILFTVCIFQPNNNWKYPIKKIRPEECYRGFSVVRFICAWDIIGNRRRIEQRGTESGQTVKLIRGYDGAGDEGRNSFVVIDK